MRSVSCTWTGVTSRWLTISIALLCMLILQAATTESNQNLGLSLGPYVPVNNLDIRFRYASTGFAGFQAKKPTYNIQSSWSWSHYFRRQWPIRTQGVCGSCWVFSAIAVVEATYAITHASVDPPDLSPQQIIDCLPKTGCRAGWPTDALEYMSTNNVSIASSYPYEAKERSRKCPASVVSTFRISSYEEVNFLGWFGLLLAVQQSPLVVFLDASSPQFLNYNSRSGIFRCASCFSNQTNHAVALVGYSFTGQTPFWILRNSWGGSWGINGYMDMAITGGVGICGINLYPALMPVVRKPDDPCNTQSYGSVIAKKPPGFPGTVNPCGGGTCTAVGALNKCTCQAPFVAATKKDGSQICVVGNPCSFFASNPCRVGTCVDGPSGAYTCLCPVGSRPSTFLYNNGSTCAASSQRASTFVVPPGFRIRCDLFYLTYGMALKKFQAQNPSVACGPHGDGFAESGSRVNITTSSKGCQLYYPVNVGDTCDTIQTLLSLNSLSAHNPGLNCSRLIPGQQVCAVEGTPPEEILCTEPQSVGLTYISLTDYVASELFDGNAMDLYALNPGLYWNRLFVKVNLVSAPTDTDICVSGTPVGSGMKGCGTHAPLKVPPGWSCWRILSTYFSGSQGWYQKVNGKPCRTEELYDGKYFCVP